MRPGPRAEWGAGGAGPLDPLEARRASSEAVLSARDRRCRDSSCRWMWEGTKEGMQVGTSYHIKTSLLHHDHFEAGRGRGKQYFVELAGLRVGAPGLEGLMWEQGDLHSFKCLHDITSTFKPGNDWISPVVGKEVKTLWTLSSGFGPCSRRGG